MDIRIKRIDPDLPLPKYETPGAAAFDLSSRVDMIIPPKSLAKIPLNVVIETPPGHMLMLASRSSMPGKKGLIVPHGFGVIDSDYCGDGDELLFQVYNPLETPVTVMRGERLAQGVFVPIDTAVFSEVQSFVRTDRGGFGSTDV